MKHKGKKKDWKKFNKSSVSSGTSLRSFIFVNLMKIINAHIQEAKAELRGKFITLND